jgi:SAM-dependent methyltransferase
MTAPATLEPPPAPNFDAIKAKQKATWEAGDYASFCKYMEAGAIDILDGWNIAKGKTLLDVGCGSGQTALPAAKNGARVTGVDIAENLIAHARQRAQEAGLDVRFDVGDAENLPYGDGSFDVAISLIGAMFAPRPERVTAEFARVLKPGGKLHMANWTAAGMPGQMFKCVARFVPPPPGLASPVLWGDEATVKQRLSDDFTDIKFRRRMYPQWHYSFDAAELVNLFRAQFGPVKKAFELIDEDKRRELRDSLEQIYRETSEMRNGVLTITHGELLEVEATRR